MKKIATHQEASNLLTNFTVINVNKCVMRSELNNAINAGELEIQTLEKYGPNQLVALEDITPNNYIQVIDTINYASSTSVPHYAQIKVQSNKPVTSDLEILVNGYVTYDQNTLIKNYTTFNFTIPAGSSESLYGPEYPLYLPPLFGILNVTPDKDASFIYTHQPAAVDIKQSIDINGTAEHYSYGSTIIRIELLYPVASNISIQLQTISDGSMGPGVPVETTINIVKGNRVGAAMIDTSGIGVPYDRIITQFITTIIEDDIFIYTRGVIENRLMG